MSGSSTSRTRQDGTSGWGYARYSAADPNATACMSRLVRRSDSASQIRRSSSTMKTTWSIESAKLRAPLLQDIQPCFLLGDALRAQLVVRGAGIRRRLFDEPAQVVAHLPSLVSVSLRVS